MIDKVHGLMLRSEYVAGVILIAAAVTKTAFPGQSAMTVAVYDIPPWMNAAIIQFELALGILLISKATQLIGATLGLVTFLAFACFSAYRAVAGYETCGCFGAMKVNPWFTFTIDISLVVLLSWKLIKRPAIQKPTSGNIALAATSYVVLGALAFMLPHPSLPQTLAGDKDEIASGSLVVLEPENWSGKKLPIASALSPNVDLSVGSWTILLYHHECPNCQAAMPLYERLAQRLLRERSSRRVALVEVPPYGPTLEHGAATSLRLTDRVDWFVQAPVEVQISNGIVTVSSRDLPSIATSPENNSQTAAHHFSSLSVK